MPIYFCCSNGALVFVCCLCVREKYIIICGWTRASEQWVGGWVGGVNCISNDSDRILQPAILRSTGDVDRT